MTSPTAPAPRRRLDLPDALALVGVLLVVVGVALVSLPGALTLAGGTCLAVARLLSVARAQSPHAGPR